jgi:hypothetical protein
VRIDRIQRALDGELDPSRLDAADAAELKRLAAAIAAAVHVMAAEPPPDLAPAVLRRIEALHGVSSGDEAAPVPHRVRSTRRLHAALAWLWKPRAVRVRPAWALVAAAALAAVLLVGERRATPVATPAAAAARPVLVQFQLDAPRATRVVLAGDFTGWQPSHELSRTAAGVWTVVVPLEPGVHEYAFLIDGERWVPDPEAPAVADGFGGLNSRVSVLPADPEVAS